MISRLPAKQSLNTMNPGITGKVHGSINYMTPQEYEDAAKAAA